MDDAAMRAGMVEALVAGGHVRSPAVARAMSRVERHRFVPEVPAVQAYRPADAVIIKRGPDGVATSSASGPDIVAAMLELLDVAPGHRVLEIGTGTGYNAALLAELVGVQGRVVSVDLDQDVVARAREVLARSGYGEVVALAQDGTHPVDGEELFDRIIVTAGTWDIPPAWSDQLAPAGRLVLPLRWRGQSQLVALRTPSPPAATDVAGGRVLTGTAMGRCEFITLVGPRGERTAQLDQEGGGRLSFDPDQDLRPDLLAAGLAAAPEVRWSGIILDPREPLSPRELVDRFWVHLTAGEPGVCGLALDSASAYLELPAPIHPAGALAIVEGCSIGYLTVRAPSSTSAPGAVEVGAVGFGPGGARLAQRLVEHLQDWNQRRDRPPPGLTVAIGSSFQETVGSTIIKTHSSLTLTI